MPFSRITYTYSGQPSFAVNFTLGYLSQDHVTARVNDEVDGSLQPVYRTITWITEGTVSISGSLTNGDTIVFERTTPKNIQQHDYQDGALLIEENLDESFLQAIMIAHEALDGRFGTLSVDLDAGNNRITNLGEGEASTDAVTVGQMTSAIAAASGLSGDFPASGVAYVNTTSMLTADNVQDAITELDAYNDTHGDIVTTDIADYATAAQGALADSAVQSIPTATESVEGAVELATTGEMTAGTANKVPDAAKVKAYVDGAVPTGDKLSDIKIFESSGTWTKPSDLSKVIVIVLGGGGEGENSGGSTGNAGGTSSFGAHCSATGGEGGQSGTRTPGSGSGGDANFTGEAGTAYDTGFPYGGAAPSVGLATSLRTSGDSGESATTYGAGGAPFYSSIATVTGGTGGGASRKEIDEASLGATETVTIGAGGTGHNGGDGGDGVVIVMEFTN